VARGDLAEHEAKLAAKGDASVIADSGQDPAAPVVEAPVEAPADAVAR
jgi:hypothetical protein